jgi:hypothetical protein
LHLRQFGRPRNRIYRKWRSAGLDRRRHRKNVRGAAQQQAAQQQES